MFVKEIVLSVVKEKREDQKWDAEEKSVVATVLVVKVHAVKQELNIQEELVVTADCL
jgi:hypothetical protein